MPREVTGRLSDDSQAKHSDSGVSALLKVVKVVDVSRAERSGSSEGLAPEFSSTGCCGVVSVLCWPQPQSAPEHAIREANSRRMSL